jgi:hypothetical protein
MKFRQVTERIGEYLGPVDWDYDFNCCLSTMGEANVQKHIERFKQIELGDEVTTYGGWPRIGWGEVLQIGMYDGWPWWKPTPSVLKVGVFGGEWEPWHSITNVRKKSGVTI